MDPLYNPVFLPDYRGELPPLPQNWLIDSEDSKILTQVEKSEFKKTMKWLDKFKHFFGYGPAGCYTLIKKIIKDKLSEMGEITLKKVDTWEIRFTNGVSQKLSVYKDNKLIEQVSFRRDNEIIIFDGITSPKGFRTPIILDEAVSYLNNIS